MIGLIERFNAKQIKQTIDHEKVKDSLAKEIKRSRSFLQHAIEK